MFIVKIMAIVTLATIVYVLLYSMQLKHIGYLIILLAGLSISGILVETITPVFDKAEQKVERYEKSLDAVEKKIERMEKLKGKLLRDGRYYADENGGVR